MSFADRPDTDRPVFIAKCDSYDPDTLDSVINSAFDSIGIGPEELAGKKVMIKPNLILGKKPELAVTTHPNFLEACAKAAKLRGAEKVTVAESPGGPYNAISFSAVCKACGIASSPWYDLNSDFGFSQVATEGRILKNSTFITPFFESDVIIDLCKLKTHSLTKMTCASKNLFGLVPGVDKFGFHATFPDMKDFSAMLADLANYVCSRKKVIAVCDAILSHEGNGPSQGSPRFTGYVLASRSVFSLDVVAEHMLKMDGEVLYLDAARELGLTKRQFDDIEIIGSEPVPCFDFKRPDSDSLSTIKNLSSIMDGKFIKLMEVRPKVNRSKCVGCGKCAASCPRKTIKMTGRKKKKAKIIHKNCIKCYYCQELCPAGAVFAKRNPILRVIH